MSGKQENAQRSGFKTFDFMRRSKLETLKTWPRDEFNLVFNIYGVFFCDLEVAPVFTSSIILTTAQLHWSPDILHSYGGK